MRTLAKVACLCLFLAISAQARTWPISKLETTIHVDQDGSAIVIERFEFSLVDKTLPPRTMLWYLGGNVPDQFFRRAVRINTPGPLGTRHMLFVRVFGLAVDNHAGAAYRARNRGDFLELEIPVPSGRNHVVEIDYLVRNAVRFLADHDELYWSTTDIDTSVQQAGLRIVLPPGVEGQFRAQGFLLGRRALKPLSPVIDASSARFESPALPPLAALTADVILPAGLLRQPSFLRRWGWFLRANPVVLLPFVVCGFMFWLWYNKARNYFPGLSVAPRYEPPEGLTPAEVGTLIDDRVDPRDVTSTLVDLAVRGYIRIEEAAPHPGLFRETPDYTFRLLKSRDAWGLLAPHERTMLFHTFYGGQWTMLSSLRLRFYAVVGWMRGDILNSLKKKGMYRVPPESAPAYRMLGFALIAALLALAGASGLFSLYQSIFPAALAAGISAGIVHLFGRKMTAKTFKGMRAYSEILGLQEFMNTVDGGRLHNVPPESFEKLLPYAMVLGLEHRWTRAFQGIAAQPAWYQFADGNLFDSVVLGDRMQFLSRQASAILSSAPRGASPYSAVRPPEEKIGAAAGR